MNLKNLKTWYVLWNSIYKHSELLTKLIIITIITPIIERKYYFLQGVFPYFYQGGKWVSAVSTSKKLREKYKLKTTLVDLLLWKYIWQSKFLVTKSSEGDKTKTYFLKTTTTTWLAVFFFSWKCVVCARAVTDAAGGQWHDGLLCLDFLVSHIYIFVFESYCFLPLWQSMRLKKILQKVAFMCFLFKCKNSNGPWPSYACCIMECDVFILYLNIFRTVLCGWWFLSGVCQIQMMCSICICTFYLYFVECGWHIFVWAIGCEMFVFVCCTAFDHLYLYITCTFLVHVPKCI